MLQLSKESWKGPQAVYLQSTKAVHRERERYTVQAIRPSPLTQEADVRANSASITKKSEALLPVISAGIEGRDGLYKHGNILLDSGAQTSLIHIELAENLRLEGKRVSIMITRGGGEVEEMTTNAYKV